MHRGGRWAAFAASVGLLVGGIGGGIALGKSGDAMKHSNAMKHSKAMKHSDAMKEQGAAMSHGAAMSAAHMTG